MYHYFKNVHFFNKQEMMIPFNEAMCNGNTNEDLFSHEFTIIRARVHQVTPVQYAEITFKPLEPFFNENFKHITLWFDADILAWMDYSQHKGVIDLYIVDDKFKPVDYFLLRAKGYYTLYKQVLIYKTIPNDVYPTPLRKGIELYLNYLNNDSDLRLYIRKNLDVPETKLVLTLLEKFRDYGLGDTQYLEIIKSLRKKHS